jgi:hypothetical protein
MSLQFKAGRLPHDPRPPRVRLRRLAGATLTPPPQSDWGCDQMNYMALNDQIGCCTIASKDHQISGQQWYGQSQSVVIPDAETLKAYSAISGYDPATGRNDNGATMQASLDYWRKVGIAGYKIEAFAQIDPRDLDMIRVCIDSFGAVDTGMWFPDFAMDQFDNGQVWDLRGIRRYRNDGGHCVPLIGYGRDYLDCWTWGRRQRMTIEFFQRFFDEVWAVADRNWQRPDGTVPNGIDGARANAEFQALTGEQGPFVEAPPAPNPNPEPNPNPVPVEDVDDELVAAFKAYSAATADFTRSFDTWYQGTYGG